MTAQEAIKAIQVEGLEITGKLSRFNEFIQGLVMAEEALEKQADIERALERLKKKEEEYLKEYRTRGHDELYGASWGLGEAIEIIKEEVG